MSKRKTSNVLQPPQEDYLPLVKRRRVMARAGEHCSSKMRRSEKMWSDDIQKVVEVLQGSFHVGEVIEDPIKYVERYKSDIKAAGPELQFLELAKPSAKSPFGWKPTSLLMGVIAERKAGKKSKRLYEWQLMEQLLTDYVFGYRADRGRGGRFAYEVLKACDVIREDDADEEFVTETLHALFSYGYWNKRFEEGLRFFAKPKTDVVYAPVLGPK